MSKRIQKMFFIIALLMGNGAGATGYEPLVPLPGFTGGVIDISSYLVGIYNFLLSIVGIVAVVYIILGGMKYITAVGNSSKISDAKDQIMSAISGLLLAILSWVVVYTLNPDILYLRQPGAAFISVLSPARTTGLCSKYDRDNAATPCLCNDNDTAPASMGAVSDAGSCDAECIAEKRCAVLTAENKCIAPGSPADASSPGYSPAQGCTCADRSNLILEAGKKCNDVCMEKQKCGNKFLVVKLNMHGAPIDDRYRTTATTALWHFALTNEGDAYEHFRISATNKLEANMSKYSCGILVTNEKTASGTDLGFDETYVYWVKEGAFINRNGDSMYRQLRDYISTASSCCAEGNGAAADCAVDLGVWGTVCDGAGGNFMTTHVLDSVWGDEVQDSCINCSFAEYAGSTVHFRPARSIRCIDGYWQ